jgi:hypothetical protein
MEETREKKPSSKGRSTTPGYRVEVRDKLFDTVRPIKIHDGFVGPEWRTVSFVQDFNPAGVPGFRFHPEATTYHHILPHNSALALAWTLLAQNDDNAYRLECRLVEYVLRTEWTLERKGAVEGVIRNEFRPAIIPDEPDPEVRP